MSKSIILSCRGLRKSYEQGTGRLEVVRGVDLEIQKGEAVCITGSSGAGKSTLLHILGTLDRPSAGQVFFDGSEVTSKTDEELAGFRNKEMGFVFQFHHLLKEFTALENVMMPCRISGASAKEARKSAEELLYLVGLKDRVTHYPSEMSGGEQQRVAIARALVRGPQLLFADEPTGNLDTENGLRVQEMFFRLKQEKGVTLIAVSHDVSFAQRFPRQLRMRDGMLQGI